MSKPGVFKQLNAQDASITPFQVYKSWRYDTSSSIDNSGILRLTALKPDIRKYSGNKVSLDTWQENLDSASLLVNSANNKEASIIWYSLNHLYYKRAGQSFNTFGYSDPYAIERTIFDKATVLSIPQAIHGESIKPGSVALTLSASVQYSNSINFIDDGKGNLIDTELSSSISGQLLYLQFNSLTYSNAWTDSTASLSNTGQIELPVNTLINDVTVIGNNINISNKTGLSPDWGNAAYFQGNSYIRIPDVDELNFKPSDDFAVAFWLNRKNSDTDKWILSNRTTGKGIIQRKKVTVVGDVNYPISQYPYDISFDSSNTISCKASDGITTAIITGSISAGERKHVLLQKSGSSFQLYLNGILQNSSSYPDKNIQNKADIFIGSLGLNNNGTVNSGMSGSIDEFFMFNKALTSTEITQLASTEMAINTNVVGNVFYEHGMIVLSDPRPKYDSIFFSDKLIDQANILNSINLQFNSTLTLYEHEYTCKIREDEFNFTSNPTIRKDNNVNSDLPKTFIGNEFFSPYITTVGLFNKYGQLVAVGKLGTPIKKRDDVDLSIIVRFDV